MLTARNVSLRQRWTGAEGGGIRSGGGQGPCQWFNGWNRWAREGAASAFSTSKRVKLGDAGLRPPSDSKPLQDRSQRRNNVKRTSHTPLVLEALAQHGHGGSRHPRAMDKVDFQFISPFHHALSRSSGRAKRFRNKEAWREARTLPPNVSHKSILANYIRLLYGVDLETQPLEQQISWTMQSRMVFHEDAIECLQSTGFQPIDVVCWAWILSAKTSFTAAARLHAVSNRALGEGEAATPTFLLQMILLRPIISARALQLLLIHSFDRLSNTPAQDWKSDVSGHALGIKYRIATGLDPSIIELDGELANRRPYPGLPETAIITLTIRLLRHARKVWPNALPYIARLFTQHVTGRLNRKSIGDAQLSFVYNKILYLLSLPSSHYFTQIKYHQEAQLIVIRAMSEFDPPLLVDRLGYRSVASVQLAHRKTSAEARWAAYKAESWPPWQEHRLGLDESIDVGAGMTRAGLALSQLSESGYATTSWEDAAAVISGWDTDNSPTIQTRRFFPAATKGALDLKNEANEQVWTARIRATRTVEEAWAIFLTCQDASCDGEEAFVAIAEKLLAKGQPLAFADATGDSVEPAASAPLPGDNLETFEASPNPRKRPYLRTPVPTPDQLLDLAESRGLRPGARLLICVLEQSCPYERGKRLIQQCSLPEEAKNMILGVEEPRTKTLQELDDRVFLAILRWCTTEFSPKAVTMLGEGRLFFDSHAPIDRCAIQVMTAFRLVSATQTTYAPAWTTLFRALTPSGQKGRHLAVSRRALLKMVELIAQMEQLEVDRTWGQFACLCRTYSLTRIVILEEDDRGITSDEHQSTDEIRSISPNLLKQEFEKLVGSAITSHHNKPVEAEQHISKPDQVPNSVASPADPLREPKAHELYIFIQALGLARDYDGILNVARWLQIHWDTLGERADYATDGRKLRRCFLAIRAFLGDDGSLPGCDDFAPDTAAGERYDAARRIVYEVAGEEAWPTEEEVAAYQPRKLAALWPHL